MAVNTVPDISKRMLTFIPRDIKNCPQTPESPQAIPAMNTMMLPLRFLFMLLITFSNNVRVPV